MNWFSKSYEIYWTRLSAGEVFGYLLTSPSVVSYALHILSGGWLGSGLVFELIHLNEYGWVSAERGVFYTFSPESLFLSEQYSAR